MVVKIFDRQSLFNPPPGDADLHFVEPGKLLDVEKVIVAKRLYSMQVARMLSLLFSQTLFFVKKKIGALAFD